MGKTAKTKKPKKVLQPSSIKKAPEAQLENLFKKAQDKPDKVSGKDLEATGDIAEARRSEIDHLLKELDDNKDLIAGLSKSIEDSTNALRGKIKGSAFGIITEGKLKEAFDIQLKEQIKENGPNDILTKTITAVNNNIIITAKYLQEILKIQVITIARIIKNTQIETNRAKKVATIANKLNDSKISIKELVDFALELNDCANDLESSLNQIKDELTTEAKNLALIAKAEAIEVADLHLGTLKTSFYESIDTVKNSVSEVKIDVVQAAKDITDKVVSSNNDTISEVKANLFDTKNELAKEIVSTKEAVVDIQGHLDKARDEIHSSIGSASEQILNTSNERLRIVKDALSSELQSAKDAVESIHTSFDNAKQDLISRSNEMIDAVKDFISNHVEKQASGAHQYAEGVATLLSESINNTREELKQLRDSELEAVNQAMLPLHKCISDAFSSAEIQLASLEKSIEKTNNNVNRLVQINSDGVTSNRKILTFSLIVGLSGFLVAVAAILLSVFGVI